MKKALLAALVAGLVAWPAVAQAKELQSAKVCGASGCETITDQPTLQLLAAGGDGGGSGPVAPAPYFRMTLTVSEPGNGAKHSWAVFYVPGTHSIGFQGESGMTQWGLVRDAQGNAFAAATTGLKPFPRPHLTRVLVDGKPAADPDSYLGLLTRPRSGPAMPGDHVWLPLDLRTAADTPWTNGAVPLQIAADGRLLMRGFDSVRLPASMAEQIRDRASLAAGGSALPWRSLALVFAAALGGAALLAAALRSRQVEARRPEPAA